MVALLENDEYAQRQQELRFVAHPDTLLGNASDEVSLMRAGRE